MDKNKFIPLQPHLSENASDAIVRNGSLGEWLKPAVC